MVDRLDLFEKFNSGTDFFGDSSLVLLGGFESHVSELSQVFGDGLVYSVYGITG